MEKDFVTEENMELFEKEKQEPQLTPPETVKNERNEIEKKITELGKLSKGLGRLERYLSSGKEDYLELLSIIKAVEPYFKVHVSEKIKPLFEELKKKVEERVSEIQTEFGRKLIEAVKKKLPDSAVEMTRAWNYKINNRFSIEIKVSDGEAVFNENWRIKSLVPEKIAEEAVSRYNSLWGKGNEDLKDIPSTIEKYHEAYKLTVAVSGEKKYGDPVPLMDFYRMVVIVMQKPALWKNAQRDMFTSYPKEQFMATLSNIISYQANNPQKCILKLLPVRNVRKALYIYSPTNRTEQYYGLIQFLEGEKGE